MPLSARNSVCRRKALLQGLYADAVPRRGVVPEAILEGNQDKTVEAVALTRTFEVRGRDVGLERFKKTWRADLEEKAASHATCNNRAKSIEPESRASFLNNPAEQFRPSRLPKMTAPATATGLPVVDNAALEVDDTLVDNDSTLGDGASSYATSLSSSVNAYTTEYGRRFHAHREKNGYIFPADQKEEDRLDMVHAMMLTLLDGKLHFAPIGTNPGRVIDLGTGTGNWAIEFADLYQSADVVGVDVSPLQPQVIPPNLKFLIDDIEEDWAQDANPFDYIHARYLVPQIKNWPRLVQQAFDSIKSGGWVEFQEWNTRIYSTDGTVTNKNAVKVWGDATIQSREAAGYDCSPGPKLEKYMKDAGFVNIQAIKLPIPLGTWPKDKKYKKVGAWNWHQVDNGLEGMAIGCLARGSGDQKPWTMEEITELCALARTELKNPGIHGQYDFYVVYGQKP